MRWLQGNHAIQELNQSGLLHEAYLSPRSQFQISREDVFRVLSQANAGLLLADNGYAVCLRQQGPRGKVVFFVVQAYARSRFDPLWKEIAAQAKRLDCDVIDAVVPLSFAKPLIRKYKFTPSGVYLTKKV